MTVLEDNSGNRACAGLAALLACWLMGSGPTPAQGEPPAANQRFVPVLAGTAFKDTSTGLVWERTPDSEHDVWSHSLDRCRAKEIGGVKGWRAPTIDELKTLVDLTQRDPALPAGHPFENIRSAIFWTATPSPTDDIVAWQLSFFTGQAVTDQKSGTRRVWCVSGQRGID